MLNKLLHVLHTAVSAFLIPVPALLAVKMHVSQTHSCPFKLFT